MPRFVVIPTENGRRPDLSPPQAGDSWNYEERVGITSGRVLEIGWKFRAEGTTWKDFHGMMREARTSKWVGKSFL